MNFYYTDADKTIIRKELLTDEALNLGRKLADQRNGIKSAQLRKYFNEVRSLEVQVGAKSYPVVEPLIKMLKSKVAYGMRSTTRLPREFKDFINKAVDEINDEKDFQAFVKHFEAILGFYYGEGGRD